MILHIDMDAFFASLEKVKHPELKNKPIAVGGKPGRGAIVSTCCYMAREFGVHSGMPSHEAQGLCPGITFIFSGFKYYNWAHKEIVKILKNYSDKIEVASVDEAYLDLKGWDVYFGSNEIIAEKIKKDIYKKLKITCSIGIASNKTIAKMASDFNKPNGLTVVNPGEEKAFLWPQAIKKMPGIGPKAKELLEKNGVFLIGDIYQAGEDFLVKLFGKWGTDLYVKASGQGSENLVTAKRRPKSISEERTFKRDLHKFSCLEEQGLLMLDKVCYRLRRHNLLANTLFLKLKFANFSRTVGQIRLPQATCFPLLINDSLEQLLGRLWTGNRPVRLLGVGLKDFTGVSQGVLFQKFKGKDLSPLYKGLDELQRRKPWKK